MKVYAEYDRYYQPPFPWLLDQLFLDHNWPDDTAEVAEVLENRMDDDLIPCNS